MGFEGSEQPEGRAGRVHLEGRIPFRRRQGRGALHQDRSRAPARMVPDEMTSQGGHGEFIFPLRRVPMPRNLMEFLTLALCIGIPALAGAASSFATSQGVDTWY